MRYKEVYPGIDLVYYGTQGELEYDFIVAPGADPGRIALTFEGGERISLDRVSGDLLVAVAGGEVRQRRPFIYQEIDGERREVEGRYRLRRGRRVGFEVGRYDRRRPLIIDPVLIYSTYLGGLSQERAQDIAVDAAGNAYLTGFTFSTDFPGPSPIQGGINGAIEDAYLVKLNPEGTAIVYGTYLGGRFSDAALSVAVDGAGNAYITGATNSSDFPTRNALQEQLQGVYDVFLAKISASGAELVYSTYLGGTSNDIASALEVDGAGNVTLAGRTESSDLPTVNARQANKSGHALYATANGGGVWTPIVDSIAAASVSALAFDPSNPATVYAGTEVGVYRSSDGGANWSLLPLAELIQVTALAVDATDPATIFIGTSFGVYKSSDGGMTSTRLLEGLFPVPVNAIVIDPTAPNTIYAGLNSFGLFKSTDGGASWATASNGIGFGNLTVSSIVINPQMPNLLYTATNRGLFRTTNAAGFWTPIGSFGLTTELAIASSNPQVLYAFGNGSLQRTVDGGDTWTPVLLPVVTNVTTIAIDPANVARVYVGTAGLGVYRTQDGGQTWSEINSGISSRMIQALLIDPSNPSTVYAGASSFNDAFIARVNAAGSELIFLTYLGGSSADQANALAIDSVGNAYLAGSTASADFPTINPAQNSIGGSSDAFVAKLSADGATLVFSSYYGGSGADQANGIAVNQAGEVFLAGQTTSNNLPTVEALQPSFASTSLAFPDAFVARLRADGSGWVFATYLGGSNRDQAQAIALDVASNIYLAGSTSSTDFPLVNPQQPGHGSNGSNEDAFLARIDPLGKRILFSTFFGGLGADQGLSVALGANNRIYLAGQTASNNFPLMTPLQPSIRGSLDGFVAQFAIQAELALTISAAPDPVFMNGRLTYTLSIDNTGPDDATGVVLSDTLPAGATFVEATASQGACGGTATVTCQLGEISSGATATISIVVTVPAAGEVSNTATLSSQTSDPNAANNTATVVARVTDRPSIFGRVALADGTGLADATVQLAGAQSAARQTDAGGAYQFAELTAGGSYTVAAARPGYVIRPESRSFADLRADERADFTAVFCRYELSAGSVSIGRMGGTASVQLMASDPLCPWTAASEAPWITITSGASGMGSAEISFNIAPATTARSGLLRIGGRRLTVFQEFDACGAVTLRSARSVAVTANNIFGLIDLAAGDLTGDGTDDLVLIGGSPVNLVYLLPGNSFGGLDLQLQRRGRDLLRRRDGRISGEDEIPGRSIAALIDDRARFQWRWARRIGCD